MSELTGLADASALLSAGLNVLDQRTKPFLVKIVKWSSMLGQTRCQRDSMLTRTGW